MKPLQCSKDLFNLINVKTVVAMPRQTARACTGLENTWSVLGRFRNILIQKNSSNERKCPINPAVSGSNVAGAAVANVHRVTNLCQNYRAQRSFLRRLNLVF